MNDKESRHIGSLVSNPFVLVKNPSPSFISLNGTYRLISGVQWFPGYNYSPQQIAPLVRFSYLMFPLFQSSSGCFHLGLFLFREQIPLLLFSHHFHFRFFQPLWKWKRHVHSEDTKAITVRLMDYISKLSKLSCIQNHDLSWIRNENATYVTCKQALYLVETRG